MDGFFPQCVRFFFICTGINVREVFENEVIALAGGFITFPSRTQQHHICEAHSALIFIDLILAPQKQQNLGVQKIG